jgi:hypothetical protein
VTTVAPARRKVIMPLVLEQQPVAIDAWPQGVVHGHEVGAAVQDVRAEVVAPEVRRDRDLRRSPPARRRA